MKELKKTNREKALKLFELDLSSFKDKSVENIFEQIRQAYKKNALKFHPDKNKSPDAEKQFKNISQVYSLFVKAYENGSLANLFDLESSSTEDVKKNKSTSFSWSFSDLIKNSLYAYYEGRYGDITKLPGYAHEKLRSMLVHILGLPAFGFWVEINSTGRGYVIKSSEQYLINIMSEFLTSIAEFALDSLKPLSYQYQIKAEDARLFCKTESIDADLITIMIKKAMKLENTANIATVSVESQDSFLVYIKTDAPHTIPKYLEVPIAIPSQTVTTSTFPQSQLSSTISVKTKKESTIQLAFGLDVTGSMGSMLSAAKQSLRKAGINIQKSMNETPDMFVVTYHDYDDEGGMAFGRGRGRFDRFSISRFSDSDEDNADRFENSSDSFNDNTQSNETKLMEALNYPGKRDEKKLPIFTTPDVVSNILDAVGPEGGGDTPEMLEAALAIATQLPWSAPVRTLYIALDAPPHFHYNGVLSKDDRYVTFDAIKTAQANLKNDPALIKATSPEDWFTQILMLARLGVKINPMVCTESKDVIFMATFIATLTGGSPIIINNSDWESVLQPVVESITMLDVHEVNPKAVVLSSSNSSHNQSNMRPDTAYYAAVMEIIKSINMRELFSKNDIKKLATKLRDNYSTAIKYFLNANHPNNPEKTLPKEYLSLAEEIRERVINIRSALFDEINGTHIFVNSEHHLMPSLKNLINNESFTLGKATKIMVPNLESNPSSFFNSSLIEMQIFKKDKNTLSISYGLNKKGIQIMWMNDERLFRICNNQVADNEISSKKCIETFNLMLKNLNNIIKVLDDKKAFEYQGADLT